ncbi:hypothetical protein [Raineyella sp. W15-4]|uniref:hypothetical protein n=1 Tax=Raineyella sp. W15-4 TaxID=3081651 RepID=UPI0029545C0C|nr:hypothetical protein [Raineyella sp. W15-4]WOQ16511.1 hypothetical protein R0145_15090 [Raineyella sp. W15-4]
MEFPAPSRSRAPLGEETLAIRARSMTDRLLSGTGCASLLAYEYEPGIEVGSMVHGLSSRGALVVASCLPPDAPAASLLDHWSTAVRMDVVKESLTPQVRIMASSLHLLGQLEWMSTDVTAGMLHRREVPRHVADIAMAPGGRLGVVHTQRILLHDASGVTPLGHPDDEGAVPIHRFPPESTDTMESDRPISTGHPAGQRRARQRPAHPSPYPAVFPSMDQEIEAYDVVASSCGDDLTRIYEALADGRLAGVIWSRRPSTPCPHTQDQTYYVDIDRTGITVMHVGESTTTTAFVAFPQEVDTLDQLGHQVALLLQDSAPQRQPRI